MRKPGVSPYGMDAAGAAKALRGFGERDGLKLPAADYLIDPSPRPGEERKSSIAASNVF